LTNSLAPNARLIVTTAGNPSGTADTASEIDDASWERALDEVVRQHDDLRERVENFGAINMRALEEYQELDERHQFLNHQRLDIEQSIADTQKAIAEINRRSVEQFQDAFARIRENFIEVFQILFRGGQCDLHLLDEGDLLESGIDIIHVILAYDCRFDRSSSYHRIRTCGCN
jgi:chromosome segregation protein